VGACAHVNGHPRSLDTPTFGHLIRSNARGSSQTVRINKIMQVYSSMAAAGAQGVDPSRVEMPKLVTTGLWRADSLTLVPNQVLRFYLLPAELLARNNPQAV
jgi:hypothetical protein